MSIYIQIAMILSVHANINQKIQHVNQVITYLVNTRSKNNQCILDNRIYWFNRGF